MDLSLINKAAQIAMTCDAAYFGVLDEDGYPHVSTISPINPDGIFEVWFSTGLASNKARRLQNDRRASVCYRQDGNNITLVGEAETLTDQETKNRFWQQWFIDHYPLGETDPNYCIIRFKTKRISLWVDRAALEITVAEYLSEIGLRT